MTKEEVLQKVNDYCTEKQYTSATLSDAFKDKFVEHFLKANPEGDINDEALLANMKFAINTAFSSASDIATAKTTEFQSKENDLKKQIEELKKTPQKPSSTQQTQQVELPKEVSEQLEELKKYKDEKIKQEKLSNILTLAKEDIRQDLHPMFERYAKKFDVKIDVDDKQQAKSLADEFHEVFKDTIGGTKPKAPVQTKKEEEEFIASIPKVEISN